MKFCMKIFRLPETWSENFENIRFMSGQVFLWNYLTWTWIFRSESIWPRSTMVNLFRALIKFTLSFTHLLVHLLGIKTHLLINLPVHLPDHLTDLPIIFLLFTIIFPKFTFHLDIYLISRLFIIIIFPIIFISIYP